MQRCEDHAVLTGVGTQRHAKLSESHEVREAIRSFTVSQSIFLHLQDLHELVFMKPITKMRREKIINTTIKIVKAIKMPFYF